MKVALPRPEPDPEFRDALLAELLGGHVWALPDLEPDGMRRRLYVVSGALAGAAALLGAALGWRLRGGRTTDRAA